MLHYYIRVLLCKMIRKVFLLRIDQKNRTEWNRLSGQAPERFKKLLPWFISWNHKINCHLFSPFLSAGF